MQGSVDVPKPFDAAWKRTYQTAIPVFAVVGVFAVVTGGVDALMPDPSGVYIEQLGHDISPSSYIAERCRNSVASVDRLDPRAFGADPNLERWDVTPRPGHTDVVLLNTITSEVTCP
jgi:hypothetical protein